MEPIPEFFFRTIRPLTLRDELKRALMDEAAIATVGEDLEDLANYVRETHEDEEVRNAAARLFPRIGEPGKYITTGIYPFVLK
jgi:lipid A disaccharide synthetase